VRFLYHPLACHADMEGRSRLARHPRHALYIGPENGNLAPAGVCHHPPRLYRSALGGAGLVRLPPLAPTGGEPKPAPRPAGVAVLPAGSAGRRHALLQALLAPGLRDGLYSPSPTLTRSVCCVRRARHLAPPATRDGDDHPVCSVPA